MDIVKNGQKAAKLEFLKKQASLLEE